ncbi:hypothetical protein FRB93_004097 [Tulasnella sp. JGI-2019a]|nr:hypothetical protein FRB93_004097 [Tulasnella sp. JGI-2019a]
MVTAKINRAKVVPSYQHRSVVKAFEPAYQPCTVVDPLQGEPADLITLYQILDFAAIKWAILCIKGQSTESSPLTASLVRTDTFHPHPRDMQVQRQDIATTGSERTSGDRNGGTQGDLTRVTTNNFETRFIGERAKSWYQYDVFEPTPERRDFRARAIAHIQDANPQVFSQSRGSYDGNANFYSIIDLGPVLTYPNVFQSKTPTSVKLTKVATIELRDLENYVMRRENISARGLNTLTLLAVLLKMGPMMNRHVANNRCVYNLQDVKNLGRGLEVVRGFYQSPRPGWGALYINVDLTAGVMYKAGDLTSFLLEFLNERDVRALFNLSPERKREINRYLKGIDLIGNHLPTGRPQQFKRLDEKTPTTFRFEQSGVEISVTEYFQRRYNKTPNPNLPLVDIGRKRMWPLDQCKIRAGQLLKKTVKITPEQVNTVLGFATQRPEKRLEAIISGIQRVLDYGSDYILNSGIDVRTQSPALNERARILRAPHLHYGNNQVMQPAQGKWNMLQKRYSMAASLGVWLILVFDTRWYGQGDRARQFADELYNTCGAVGMAVQRCSLVQAIGPNNIQQDIASACEQAAKKSGAKRIDLIVCILPANSQPIKTAIKRFGDIQHGIATQIVIGTKLKPAGTNPSNQYCNNLALKINSKLGGTNWMSSKDAVPFLAQRATMIIGIDTSHGDTAGGTQPSVAAFVSSVDYACSKYVGQCRLQGSRQEVVDSEALSEMTSLALTKYRLYHAHALGEKTPVPPRQILVYRDGVSESQFQEVIANEYEAIKAGFKRAGVVDDYYRITFISVGKKHHFRMFPTGRTDNSGNCHSGTVVDTQVVNPWINDFYLLSHAGLLGTSRPAHYSVLVNDLQMTVDQLQSVSFALCHLFTRSTRTVSIPAPVYHADLIAARLRYHIQDDELFSPEHRDSSESIRDPEELLMPWRKAWQPVHRHLEDKMYWM